MKNNKLKGLLIACIFSVLWTEIQGADEEKDPRDEPTGSIMAFAGEVPPNGWLLCDGKQYSNQKYPELYGVIQTRYVPDGSWIIEANRLSEIEKFFHVPDLNGRVIVGVDKAGRRVTSNNLLGASSGEEYHPLTLDETPDHETLTGRTNLFSGGNGIHLPEKRTASLEFGKPYNNMQPYLVLNYIISTGRVDRRGESAVITQLKREISDLRLVNDQCSAKFWCRFDGTAVGTNPPSSGYNVASVSRLDAGRYEINFIVPFATNNYCVSISSSHTTRACSYKMIGSLNTGSCSVYTAHSIGDYGDCPIMCVHGFGS